MKSSSSTSPFEEDADLAFPASFQPKVRSTIELFSEARVDTAFDKENENVLELRMSGKFSLDVDFAKNLSAFIAPGFAYQAAWTESLDDRGFLFLQIPEAYITWELAERICVLGLKSSIGVPAILRRRPMS